MPWSTISTNDSLVLEAHAQLSKDLAQAKTEIQQLRRQNEALSAQKNEEEKKAKKMSLQLQSVAESLGSYAEQEEEIQEVLDAMGKQLQQEMHLKAKREKEFQAAVKEQDARHSHLKDELAASEARAESVKLERDNSAERLRQLLPSLRRSIEQRSTEQEARYSCLKDELAASEAGSEALRKEVSALQAANQEHTETTERLRRLVPSLQRSITKQMEMQLTASSKSRGEEVNRCLEEQRQRIQHLEQQLAESQKQRGDDVNLCLEEKQQRIEELEEQLAESRKSGSEEERHKIQQLQKQLSETQKSRSDEGDTCLEEQRQRIEQLERLLVETQKSREIEEAEARCRLEQQQRQLEYFEKQLSEANESREIEEFARLRKQAERVLPQLSQSHGPKEACRDSKSEASSRAGASLREDDLRLELSSMREQLQKVKSERDVLERIGRERLMQSQGSMELSSKSSQQARVQLRISNLGMPLLNAPTSDPLAKRPQLRVSSLYNRSWR
eukprot:TRINITY_DN61623_c0_g1_i1.p1 TRINITY_DN61623_c0_g1~~TRINITY_DN61623_c0_g1_i1.p1  ORF type:complete len:517 (+),score=139.60 TRINITY_DN61623_c0_g1_i1:47-1552(+)